MILWLLLGCWSAAVGARAEDAGRTCAEAGMAEFTAAYQAWDAARFAAAAEWFGRAATNAPPAALHFYWQGVAQFHQMLQLRTRSDAPAHPRAAEAAMNAALAALNRAVQLDPHHAESHALLGTLYGMKIDGNLMRALRFGPRVERHRKRALALGADNPRVQYLLGVCQFHTAKTPADFREALATLRRAETLFAVEAQRPAQPLEPRWGRSTCLTFLGRTCERLGQRAEAAAAFEQALALHPTDHMARAGLSRVSAAP